LHESKTFLVAKVTLCSLQPCNCFFSCKAIRIPWLPHVSICRVGIASKGGLLLEAATFASRVEPASLRLLGGAENLLAANWKAQAEAASLQGARC